MCVCIFVVQNEDFVIGESNQDNIGARDTWDAWSAWTKCSKPCGTGRRTRERKCNTEDKVRVNCTGGALEIGDCNTDPCPGEDN